MTSTDPISDMLTRIRNAILVNKHQISLPHSKIKQSTATILKEQGYIDDVKTVGDGVAKSLEITINDLGNNSRINHIKRVSKPGRRIYSKAKQMPMVKNGRGFIIVSTSRGLMTGDQARKQSLGGEIICEVY